MALNYFKRYRMESSFSGRERTWVKLPAGFRLLPWHKSLLDSHAEVKFLSFHDEMDANLFPCFTDLAGCRRLMTRFRGSRGSSRTRRGWRSRRATTARGWSLAARSRGFGDRFGYGAIQNLGITPAFRNRGLGTVLLFAALRGFWRAGLRRVYLEVTADNEGAIRLYRRHGFRVMKTLYKAVEAACS